MTFMFSARRYAWVVILLGVFFMFYPDPTMGKQVWVVDSNMIVMEFPSITNIF